MSFDLDSDIDMKSFMCSTSDLREKVVNEYPFQVIYRLNDTDTEYVNVLCFRTKVMAQCAFHCIHEQYKNGKKPITKRFTTREMNEKMNMALPQTLDISSQFSSYTFSDTFFDKSVIGWMYCRYFHNEGWKTFTDCKTIWNVTRHDTRVGGEMIPEFIVLLDFTRLRKYEYRDVFGW